MEKRNAQTSSNVGPEEDKPAEIVTSDMFELWKKKMQWSKDIKRIHKQNI